MKTYFGLRNFLWNAMYSTQAAVIFKSYKVDGVELLTPLYFVDNQNAGVNPTANFEFCMQNAAGTIFTPPTPNINYSNNFNPFKASMGLNFPEVGVGIHRGQCTGAFSGQNYGTWVNNLYCDKQLIVMGLNDIGLGHCIFALDIDYTKDFRLELDLVGNYHESTLYDNPDVFRTYVIEWQRDGCKKSFYYKNAGNETIMPDDALGFLAGNTEIGQPAYVDLSDIDCSPAVTCEEKERTRSFAMYVTIPEADTPRPSLKECCFSAQVFADLNSDDYEKNDFTGLYHEKQLPNETAEFKLIDVSTGNATVLNDQTNGVYKDFGSIAGNLNLKTFVLEWKKILDFFGEGTYTLIKTITIAGQEIEQGTLNYTLKQYTPELADKTVRIDGYMDGYMENLATEFKGSDFRTAMRFGGFFGRREPKYEEDNIVYGSFINTQISMMQTNEYTMQSNLLPSCMTLPIIDFILFANDIYMNDYNFNNHLRTFVKFPVKYADNKGTGYFSTTAKAQLNLTFSDKKVNKIKRNY